MVLVGPGGSGKTTLVETLLASAGAIPRAGTVRDGTTVCDFDEAESKHGRSVGFHDSQPVGSGQVSHACIRVCCNHAKTINQNTWSGKTTVNVV